MCGSFYKIFVKLTTDNQEHKKRLLNSELSQLVFNRVLPRLLVRLLLPWSSILPLFVSKISSVIFLHSSLFSHHSQSFSTLIPYMNIKLEFRSSSDLVLHVFCSRPKTIFAKAVWRPPPTASVVYSFLIRLKIKRCTCPNDFRKFLLILSLIL